MLLHEVYVLLDAMRAHVPQKHKDINNKFSSNVCGWKRLWIE